MLPWLKYVLLFVVIVLFATCKEHVADTHSGNRTPRTFLWLYPDSVLNTGVSRQRLHWYGEDPDGIVAGFLFAYTPTNGNATTAPQPDTLRYTWVTGNDTTLLFPLTTIFERFVVVVRSVDNGFAGLPLQSIVRMVPFPYWDKNDNGVFDGGDIQLTTLSGAMDPQGAVRTFPIRNTPPSVSFVPNPNDPTIPLKQPDTTYTVATFSWTGTDPDGNNTLVSYRIALNDTSNPQNWLTVSLRDTLVTLVVPRTRSDAAPDIPGTPVTADVWSGTFIGGNQKIGQLPGFKLDALNILYVQVKDVAGEYSRAITMPSGNDRWFVKRPRGRLLLVSDYIAPDSAAAYSCYLNNLSSFVSIDEMNIGRGLTAVDKSNGRPGAFAPPFVDPALVNTFLLYDYVFWYTDQYPSLGVAQYSLFTYLHARNDKGGGGKVLFSTTFQSSIDPRGALRDFAPIDSVSSAISDTRIPTSYMVYPDSTNPTGPYPTLQFNPPAPPNNIPFFYVFLRQIYRRSDARYLYHMQPDSRGRYQGTPNVAVVDGQGTIIFVGLPLHLLDNTAAGAGLNAFFTRVFTREFNPLQRVNRMIY